MKIIFIDGYNVINSWKELRDVNTGSMESSRKKLIDILLNYGTYNEYKIFLVFDGHLKHRSLENKEKINKLLTVVFTKEGETADSFIERNVNEIGRKSEVMVVTSDLLEQQLIFQRGAIRMSSIEFHHEVKKVEHSIKKESKNKDTQKKYTVMESIDSRVAKKLEEMRRKK